MKNKQNGMSMIGLLIGMSVLGFLVYTGMRLGPIYSENYGVVKAMKVVANKPGASSKSPSVLKEELLKGFWASYVDNKRVNKKHIKIIRSRGKQLQVKYTVQEPFIGNLDFLIHFEKTMPLK
ncbi:MAG: DUF4845 domain-containing protein [Proteobacteria bacterium]|nr:DUF4845 domain-containing protein [Pseudomonadota bacterium]